MNTTADFHYNRAGLRASWNCWVGNGLHPPIGPAWLQLAWTALFCTLIAVPFTVLGLALARDESVWTWRTVMATYGTSLVIAWVTGFTVHALFSLARVLFNADRVERWPQRRRGLLFAGIPMLGVALGWPLGVTLAGFDLRQWFTSPPARAVVMTMIPLSLLISVLFFLYFSVQARRVKAEQRATEAQLRLLQGQIEPHFLFNTLANVVGLIEHDPARARQMLERFTDYLRGSLGRMRDGDTTLGAELDLVDAYLCVLKARMDDRLNYRIDVAADLRPLALPPLLLQPLVENAVRHGLEPQVEGGQVTVQARREGEQLVLSVCDDGRGPGAPRRPLLGQPDGNGVGLANLRERLASRYGGGASLTLEALHPGTCATLRLPWPHTPA